ncbi:hypothetical protein ABIA16_004616 [Sinorhizobium fredii]
MSLTISQETADRLVNAPAEALNVEIKRWISPSEPAGIAKIAIACMALRNRNGGYLIIGFDNNTLEPTTEGIPADVKAEFHIDVIQQIVSKYSSVPFEVSVAFGKRDGMEFPVIGVGGGVTAPVAASKELTADNKSLIRQHAVYFRTLNASGVPSSSPARHSDWNEIVEICFENREADIGRFLRRHLGIGGAKAFLELAAGSEVPSLRERAVEALNRNEERMTVAVAARGHGQLYAERGTWSALLLIDPPLPDDFSAQKFFNVISSANPNYTGWPVWLDSRSFQREEDRPILVDKIWEASIIELNGGWSGSHADFYRLNRSGELYLWRVLQDDLTDKVPPGAFLDPGLMIYRVLETLVVGLAFAKAFGRGEETTLAFAFRWKNLASREIDAWADRTRYFSSHGKAMGAEAEGFIEIRADTPPEAVAAHAQAVTRDLFELWGGWEYPLKAIEQQLERLLKRTM